MKIKRKGSCFKENRTRAALLWTKGKLISETKFLTTEGL
jgi:hypothetical protein